jgi:hypothetical protein
VPAPPAAAGIMTIGARHKANFCPAGSKTETWQVYRPGASFASGTLNFTGTALDFGSRPSVICRGAVSEAFTLPRLKLRVGTRGCMVSAPVTGSPRSLTDFRAWSTVVAWK